MDGLEHGQARQWAREEFGDCQLGDFRRTKRLVSMATEAARRPSGRVSAVYQLPADRQGAYDFLEGKAEAAPIVEAMARACGRRCDGLPFVFVPVDGTSLTLVDRRQVKDFGAVGTYSQQGCGLKMLGAIAVSPGGVPLGVTAMRWWKRPRERPNRTRSRHAALKIREKETQHWHDAVDATLENMAPEAPSTRIWFQLDREGDSWSVLRHLQAKGHSFTVRSRSNRRLHGHGKTRYLRDALRKKPIGEYALEVSAGAQRSARTARMIVRVANVTLSLHNSWTKTRYRQAINVVHVREVGTTPPGEKAIEWTLLTNESIATLADAELVVFGYCQRWRIEEFHRAWKTGVCDVEGNQLRKSAHVIKWATLLAAVAIRVERLKYLARNEPETPASQELAPAELKALLVLRRKYTSRKKADPEEQPTIEVATKWIAELGGYTGKSSGGPPGSTTIARGLELVLTVAGVIEELETTFKKR